MDSFSDLPDALVRDLLAKTQQVSEGVAAQFQELAKARSRIRNEAESAQLIRRKADLEVVREPSVVGIDGSYQLHRLTALDLCAAAAVAVEGTAKEATRHWQEPFHEMWVESVPHEADTTGALRAMMISMELGLASNAPHDLVLLDGSFSSLIIYLNQGLTSLEGCPKALREGLSERWFAGTAQKLIELLGSERVVAVPKFTSRNELSRILKDLPCPVDGKTLATIILAPGEFTPPLVLNDSGDGSIRNVDHLPRKFCPDDQMTQIQKAMAEVAVVYYRPFGWLPALRLELTGAIASSRTRLAIALEGITRQLFTPAVSEPYPLFLADRMVKSLGSGVAVIEQAVSQYTAASCSDAEMALLCLQNYRTEGGRGGV